MKIITKYLFKATLLLSFILSSCYNDVLVTDIDIDPNIEISYSEVIQPIFNQDCSTVGCHNQGNTKPFLGEGNSYQALINGNYIDIQNPENSELYQWMAGNRKLDMPLGGANLENNAYVLKWIEQGAKNN